MSDWDVTDLFSGAGGSSLGATSAGATIVLAANHWQTALDVHQANFPDARHDCADISQVDPRRYPRTKILIASPECTNHSQARGISRKRQEPGFWDAPDPAAERSRATMWDVVRFTEQMRYEAVVVENVIEATKWVLWPAWRAAMESLGYTMHLLSHNSMHHGVPQSRDRIFVVWLRNGIDADLELEVDAWCPRCDGAVKARQAWKNGRTVGRYGQQWVWGCTVCGAVCDTVTEPAAKIIDWSLDCPRIGDRTRPLAPATRARILAGMQRYGWAPITTTGAGNGFERTPGNRARSVDEPLPVQSTTATSALAVPPAFGINTAHGGRLHDVDDPLPTVCASDDRLSLVVQLRGTGAGQISASARPTSEPLGTVSAGGQHHGLIVTNHGPAVNDGDIGRRSRSTKEPMPSVLAGGNHQALLMRNNSDGTDGAHMVTPVTEPARTMTTTGHQSLLVPYYGQGNAQPVERPVPTVPTKDRFALVDLESLVDDCGFRMLEPYEVAAAMAFPVGYIPRTLAKRDQVKLAGNAVTPPVMSWIIGRVIQALEAVA